MIKVNKYYKIIKQDSTKYIPRIDSIIYIEKYENNYYTYIVIEGDNGSRNPNNYTFSKGSDMEEDNYLEEILYIKDPDIEKLDDIIKESLKLANI